MTAALNQTAPMPYRTTPPIPPPLTAREKAGIAWTVLKPGATKIAKTVGKCVGIVGAALFALYWIGRLLMVIDPVDWNATATTNGGSILRASPICGTIFGGIVGVVVGGALLMAGGMVLLGIGAVGYWTLIAPFKRPVAKVKAAIAAREEQRKHRELGA